MPHVFKWMESPIGKLKLVASDAGLAAVLWANDKRRWKHLCEPFIDMPGHPVLCEAEAQLDAYLAGQWQVFSVALDLHGTPFQETVWHALLAIPFGQVTSYGEIARRIGRPNAVRAVGAAVGMNPVSIMAPCHRVLGASGTLTGFAGGLTAKLWLLGVEGIKHRPSAKDPGQDSAPELPLFSGHSAGRGVRV